MQANAVDYKIADFLYRKSIKFPELEILGRNESQTIKFDPTMAI